MKEIRRIKNDDILHAMFGNKSEDIVNEISVRVEHCTSKSILDVALYK
jgi:hypothetical protein